MELRLQMNSGSSHIENLNQWQKILAKLLASLDGVK